MKKSDKESRKRKGEDFEKEIADLYEAMGYEVECNQSIAGQEVDIFAIRHISGSGQYKLMVECKYKGGKTLAGNQDIQSIAGAFNIAKGKNEIHACTIVTTNGFSLAAQEAAKTAGINIKTKHQLIRELIDFSYYLNNLRIRYNEDFGVGENLCYIEPTGRDENEIDRLDNIMDKWLASKSKTPLVLRGSYGTGKTSFCNHYAIRLIDKPECPIPIIIPLKNFTQENKVDNFIRNFLKEECDVPDHLARFETFWKMYCEGMLLLFFDGLDEIADRVDSSVLEISLIEIDRFARRIGNVVLTCRPEFFIDEKEEKTAWFPFEHPFTKRMSIYKPICLEMWDEEQVRQFVQKKFQNMKSHPSYLCRYYTDKILKLPELKDMARRAVHLDLIVKMLPTMLKQNIIISRTNLYKTYIDQEINREVVEKKRPSQIISSQDRLELMIEIASENFFRPHDFLDFQIASEIIRKKLRIPNTETESVTRDFLNRSFLHRKGNIYHFAHDSIGEYLFAFEVFNRLKKGNIEFLKNIKISSTVAGMTLEQLGGLKAFPDLLLILKIESDQSIVKPDLLYKIEFAMMSILDYISNICFDADKTSCNDEMLPKSFIRDLIHEIRENMTPIRIGIQRLKQKKEIKDESKIISIISSEWKNLLKNIDLLIKNST